MARPRGCFQAMARGFRCADGKRGTSINKSVEQAKGDRRKWQAHQGKNTFWCGGRIIMANNEPLFLLTYAMVVLTVGMFSVFDLPYLTTNVSAAIPIVFVILFLYGLTTLFRIAYTDPGIIPRSTPEEMRQWETSDPFFHTDEWRETEKTEGDTEIKERQRIVQIAGKEYPLKKCQTCNILRPPRAVHCSVCDNCVECFDHHCPWLGNCIGKRNYKYYLWFIVLNTVLTLYIILCIALHIYLLSKEKGSFLQALMESAPSVCTAILSAILFYSTAELTWRHCWLIGDNLTTKEDYTCQYDELNEEELERGEVQWENPFKNDAGLCRNLLMACCAPDKISLLDRQTLLPPEEGPVIYVDEKLLEAAKQNRAKRMEMMKEKNRRVETV